MSIRARHPAGQHISPADERRENLTTPTASKQPIRYKPYPPGGLSLSGGELRLLVVITLLACYVRLYRLARPDSVVFDEVHFGKFASKYIKTQYFVDVHPPLAKLLITLVGFLGGYDGSFDFKDIGKPYPSNVPYVLMRFLGAFMGVLTVPLTYLTLRMLDCRATTALLGCIFVTFENALVTQSRYILLDSPLLFFTALTTFFWVGFCNEDKHAGGVERLSETWWAWLVLTGLSMGAGVSVKWVGLFMVATIGVGTLIQLWNLLGDLRVSPSQFIRLFLARVLCLIVIPFIFYMAMFQIHFLILNSSGDGDGFMSSAFQHTLSGRGMEDTFADVAFGSQVTIRHLNTQGGYLHSHPHNYPGGSKQQQITLYPHRDSNNVWIIKNATHDAPPSPNEEEHEINHIMAGTRINLVHFTTEKRLHSHDIRPPMSEVDFQNEVSAYGMTNFSGDMNDDWIVEIERGEKGDKESYKRVKTLRTIFRLRHPLTGCYLFSHKVKLPDWGYEQQEVTCNKNAVRDNSLWFIESNANHLLTSGAPKVNYRPLSFFAKFVELQGVMWNTNKGLTDSHTFQSRPEDWPRLKRGINFWVKDHRHVYLIGNPFVWWLSTLGVVVFVGVRGLLILRAQRGWRDFENSKVVKYNTLTTFFFTAYMLHYLPFYLMSRQLFLHHYLPALYFAILLSSTIFDALTSALKPKVRLQVGLIIGVIAIWTFLRRSPLVYGTEWTKKECLKAKWGKGWDFSCNDYYDEYSQYTPISASASISPTLAASITVGGEPGGRGPIVVENPDGAGRGNEKVEQTSTIGAAAVEPGRDVFAEAAKKGVESSSAVPEKEAEKKVLEAEKEVKVVSLVDGGTGKDTYSPPETTSSVSVASEESSSSSSSDSAASSSSSSSSTDSSSSSTSSSSTSSTAEKPDNNKKEAPSSSAAGPLNEEEAEAKKIAEELFGGEILD